MNKSQPNQTSRVLIEQSNASFTRRRFMGSTVAASVALTMPRSLPGFFSVDEEPIGIGLIADLHQDIMHDGPERLNAFLSKVNEWSPDAIMQLGDFAVPSDENQPLVDAFHQGHEHTFHVIGNHDTDGGYAIEEVVERWNMPARYYKADVRGLTLLVLDGNDRGSPTHQGGYPRYIGEEQQVWLQEELNACDGPVIVCSHQPLNGASSVDNGEAIQDILAEHSDKILLAINGHTHVDSIRRVKNVTYWHVNSASYQWVGGNHVHDSYSADVHEQHPWIAYTCPYRDPLFAFLKIDFANGRVEISGTSTEWVGPSPAEIGASVDSTLTHGEEIAPRIRDRIVERISS